MSMLLLICDELGCPPYLYALTTLIEAQAMHVSMTLGKVLVRRGTTSGYLLQSLQKLHRSCYSNIP
jgi:hypothetical protein